MNSSFDKIIPLLLVIILFVLFPLYASADMKSSSLTVILDAGHGGEDGGAVAADGTNEKDLNLSIAKKTALFFDLFGINYIMTRDSDMDLSDNELNTIRERKINDIHKRYDLVNSTPGAVLLSIHMNYFPVEKYSGAQFFYASSHSSELLADILQHHIKEMLQPENNRMIKPSPGTVYLLDKAKRPSVLAECGFISNIEELNKLKTKEYQSCIGYIFARSISDFRLKVGE